MKANELLSAKEKLAIIFGWRPGWSPDRKKCWWSPGWWHDFYYVLPGAGTIVWAWIKTLFDGEKGDE